MYSIDLNSDLGESFGNYVMGEDEQILPYVTSANVACGFHAADPCVMKRTITLAKENGVEVGAHPGFPDLMGFGRRRMEISTEEMEAYILYQISAIGGMCHAAGVRLAHVKPHGALYNMASQDYRLAQAVCRAIASYDKNLIVMALSQSALLKAAQDMGLPVAREVFADRGYEEDGSLVDRKKEGALLTDVKQVIKRVIRMIKEQKVTAVTGKDIAIQADSLCVHGDGKEALAFVREINKALKEEGIAKVSLRKKCSII